MINAILDLVFPISCVICGREKTWLCPACAGAVVLRPFRSCPECLKVSTGGAACGSCRTDSPLSGLTAAAPYSDPAVRKLICGLKYGRARSALPAVVALLRRSNVSSRLPPADLIIPVPLHRVKKHLRGFNQTELIAAEFAGDLGLPVSVGNLARRKKTEPQAKLRDEERSKNLRDAFQIVNRGEIDGKRVILVDDVFTSGWTMREAARVLREAGASEVWGLAVAYG